MEDKTKYKCGCNNAFCPDNLTENDALAVAQLNKVDEATCESIYELFDSFDILDYQPKHDENNDADSYLDLFENPNWVLWERQFLNV